MIIFLHSYHIIYKNRILIQAQKELKEKTDISFDFEEIKTGRKVTNLKFYIHKNKTIIKSKPNKKICEEIACDSAMEDTNLDKSKGVKYIVELMEEHNISSEEALKIYSSSSGDLENITKVYDYFKNKKADNFIGLMIKMVKPGEFIEPKKNF